MKLFQLLLGVISHLLCDFFPMYSFGNHGQLVYLTQTYLSMILSLILSSIFSHLSSLSISLEIPLKPHIYLHKFSPIPSKSRIYLPLPSLSYSPFPLIFPSKSPFYPPNILLQISLSLMLLLSYK